MARHLDSSWLSSFTAGAEEHKRSLVATLVSDWLNSHPPGVDHCAAVVELHPQPPAELLDDHALRRGGEHLHAAALVHRTRAGGKPNLAI